jgi:uncharacterized membrane protein
MNNLEVTGENKGNKSSGPKKFLILFLIGFVMILVGIMILVTVALFYGGSTINFGAVIFIGPFPIVIGVGPDAGLMVLFAITLAVLSIIMFLILRREMTKIDA